MKTNAHPFHFKQFVIHQDRCAMKVGTDGVLLGAWVQVSKTDKILDIGCGSGLISLMLAQRGGEKIDAIDIEENAFHQSKENFNHSKWNKKLEAHHLSLSEFVIQQKNKYDLIVSNPPYFQVEEDKSLDARTIARSQHRLTYENLIEESASLMTLTSRLCLVIPFQDFERVQDLAKIQGLSAVNYCVVRGNTSSHPNRVLVEFRFSKKSPIKTSLSIEKRVRHDYTDKYIEMLKDYLTVF